jgi:hypothetical protein
MNIMPIHRKSYEAWLVEWNAFARALASDGPKWTGLTNSQIEIVLERLAHKRRIV